MNAPYPNDGLFAICDPEGHIDHTTVTPDAQQSIAEFLSVEQAMHQIYSWRNEAHGEMPVCTPSWEVWEAQGYQVISIIIHPA